MSMTFASYRITPGPLVSHTMEVSRLEIARKREGQAPLVEVYKCTPEGTFEMVESMQGSTLGFYLCQEELKWKLLREATQRQAHVKQFWPDSKIATTGEFEGFGLESNALYQYQLWVSDMLSRNDRVVADTDQGKSLAFLVDLLMNPDFRATEAPLLPEVYVRDRDIQVSDERVEEIMVEVILDRAALGAEYSERIGHVSDISKTRGGVHISVDSGPDGEVVHSFPAGTRVLVREGDRVHPLRPLVEVLPRIKYNAGPEDARRVINVLAKEVRSWVRDQILNRMETHIDVPVGGGEIRRVPATSVKVLTGTFDPHDMFIAGTYTGKVMSEGKDLPVGMFDLPGGVEVNLTTTYKAHELELQFADAA